MSTMDKNVLVSIIVPVYNTSKYLRKCVSSLIGQTYSNIEILLIDDGSTDDSGEICDAFSSQDSRVRAFHKENGGVSSARNLGLKNATGYYVTFVDADDWLETDCIDVLMKANHNDYDILAFSCTKDFEHNSVKVFYYNTDRIFNLSKESDLKEVYNMKLCGSSCMKLYKRQLIKYEYNTNISNGEDVLFNIENIGNFENILYCRLPAYHMTCRIDSASRNTDFAVLKKYEYAFSVIKEKISNQYLKRLYYSFIAACSLQIILFVVYPKGTGFYKGKRLLKELLNKSYISDMLHNADQVDMGFMRKISILCCKNHLYFMVYIIATIKHLLDK